MENVALPAVECVIDYTDARGERSRRAITPRMLTMRQGHLQLQAVCHMRHAVRHFRVDRIRSVIDADGIVTGWDEYARDTLGVDIAHVGPTAAARAASDMATAVRNRLRAPLSLLILAARESGRTPDAALDIITDYALVEARQRDDLPVPPRAALRGIIARTRPRDASLAGHARAFSEYPGRDPEAFGAALDRITAEAPGTHAAGVSAAIMDAQAEAYDVFLRGDRAGVAIYTAADPPTAPGQRPGILARLVTTLLRRGPG